MSMRERIAARLVSAFDPSEMEVVDESRQHAGHAGARPGGETHFRIVLTSAAFAGRNRVQRHRLVYEALGAEIGDGVHALALRTRAPGES